MRKKYFEACFMLAGFEYTNIYEVLNEYDGDLNAPWYLFRTEFGLIKIGWRKRVISIDWSDCKFDREKDKFDQVIFKDDVTKWPTGIHAWGYHKAIEYLMILLYNLRIQRRDEYL